MTEIKQGSFTLLECAERMLEASRTMTIFCIEEAIKQGHISENDKIELILAFADLMEKEAQTFKQSFKRTQSDQKSEIFNF